MLKKMQFFKVPGLRSSLAAFPLNKCAKLYRKSGNVKKQYFIIIQFPVNPKYVNKQKTK